MCVMLSIRLLLSSRQCTVKFLGNQNVYMNFWLCRSQHPQIPTLFRGQRYMFVLHTDKARKRNLAIHNLKLPKQLLSKDSLGFCCKHASELALSMRNVFVCLFVSLKKVSTFSVSEFSFFISLKFLEYKIFASIYYLYI